MFLFLAQSEGDGIKWKNIKKRKNKEKPFTDMLTRWRNFLYNFVVLKKKEEKKPKILSEFIERVPYSDFDIVNVSDVKSKKVKKKLFFSIQFLIFVQIFNWIDVNITFFVSIGRSKSRTCIEVSSDFYFISFCYFFHRFCILFLWCFLLFFCWIRLKSCMRVCLSVFVYVSAVVILYHKRKWRKIGKRWKAQKGCRLS